MISGDAAEMLDDRRRKGVGDTLGTSNGASSKLPVDYEQIRRKIPAECFERHAGWSLYYVGRAGVTGVLLAMAYVWAAERIESSILGGLVLAAYAAAQGLNFFAVFLIGHDCTHGSFSRYPWLNETIGNLVQGFVLVPHFPWRLSHAHHHAVTNNLDDDEGFGPIRESWASPGRARAYRLAYAGLGVSFLLYFYVGASPHGRRHFCFWDPFFRRRLRACATSVVWYAANLAAAVWLLLFSGAGDIFVRLYVLPLLVFGSCAVVVFFAHHNDWRTRWYSRSAWRPDVVVKTGTVDRTWGRFLDNVILHIAYHQVHHIFPTIPHYRLKQATVAFRAAFPELATVATEGFVNSTLRNFALYVRKGYVTGDADVVNMYDPG